jgi:hypothetical protein
MIEFLSSLTLCDHHAVPNVRDQHLSCKIDTEMNTFGELV